MMGMFCHKVHRIVNITIIYFKKKYVKCKTLLF